MSAAAMTAAPERAMAAKSASAALAALGLRPRDRARTVAAERRRLGAWRIAGFAGSALVTAEGLTILHRPKLLRIARIAIGHTVAMPGIVMPDVT